MRMKGDAVMVRWTLLICLSFLLEPLLASGAGSSQSLPPILEAGFDSWAKGGGVETVLMGSSPIFPNNALIKHCSKPSPRPVC